MSGEELIAWLGVLAKKERKVLYDDVLLYELRKLSNVEDFIKEIKEGVRK